MTKQRLDTMTPAELGKLFPVFLSPYDPKWPVKYLKEKERIMRRCCFPVIRMEHIGSTAVPGLTAKPTIDILTEIPEDTDTATVIRSLKKAGYRYLPKPENPPPHMMFVRGYTPGGFRGQAFHLHLRYPGIQDEILLRDLLRTDPDLAQAYVVLKTRLAKRFRNDREAYTEGKTDFVARVLKTAEKTSSDRTG